MTGTVQEIERKYETAGGTPALPPLDGIEGVAEVADGPTATLDATYYDTADLRLVTHGSTLRRRTGGGDAGWHLKLPVGPDTREEIRLPLGTGTEVPPQLAALVRARTRGRPLLPVVRLVSVREVRLLRDAEGRTLAEVAWDRVTAHRIDRSAPEVAAPVEWAEVEVELAEADPAFLDTVERQLAAAGLHRGAAASKLARVLGIGPAPAAAVLGRRTTAGDAVLRYLAEHTEQLTALDAAVRRDRPDAVHRMRVSTRRLRSTLKTFRTVLDRRATEWLAEELKWLGAELGAERDREVLTERLDTRVAELPDALVVGPVPARLRIRAVRRRAETGAALQAALDSPRYLALLDALDALAGRPPLLPAAHRPAARVLSRAVRRDWRRLARRMEVALAAPPGHQRDLLLHEARKAAKRARYAAEAARPVLGRPAKRFGARLKAMQQLLGEHQDSVVARTALRELAAQADAAGESAFSYGLLHQVEHDRAATAERQLPRAWRRASRRRLRRRHTG
ncbi:CYTH and CHAD domain-containing protein [Peterkaempfera bronchialis]|uniref:CHAD domain-containing protein n=1 Tax=Peterkaempfera bronchialis TaxID=2126346 RepID=A0A345SUZ3_9ACTN|nr:CYTH and CHAD domain-containing protein [Peterkaempfera bronchialis]AXI77548.1 CHAD domain-containing protein [Peterkaempfera bronchialis]